MTSYFSEGFTDPIGLHDCLPPCLLVVLCEPGHGWHVCWGFFFWTATIITCIYFQVTQGKKGFNQLYQTNYGYFSVQSTLSEASAGSLLSLVYDLIDHVLSIHPLELMCSIWSEVINWFPSQSYPPAWHPEQGWSCAHYTLLQLGRSLFWSVDMSPL